jgi:hypothetical protein
MQCDSDSAEVASQTRAKQKGRVQIRTGPFKSDNRQLIAGGARRASGLTDEVGVFELAILIDQCCVLT